MIDRKIAIIFVLIVVLFLSVSFSPTTKEQEQLHASTPSTSPVEATSTAEPAQPSPKPTITETSAPVYTPSPKPALQKNVFQQTKRTSSKPLRKADAGIPREWLGLFKTVAEKKLNQKLQQSQANTTVLQVKVLVVGDSLARYAYVGMRERFKLFDWSEISSTNKKKPKWELFLYEEEWQTKVLHIDVGGGIVMPAQFLLRYEREQYISTRYNWSTALTFNPDITILSRGPWDVLYRYDDIDPKAMVRRFTAAFKNAKETLSSSSSGHHRVVVYGTHKLHARYGGTECAMTTGCQLLREATRVATAKAGVAFFDAYEVSKDFQLSHMINQDGIHYINEQLFSIVDHMAVAMGDAVVGGVPEPRLDVMLREGFTQAICPEYAAAKRKSRLSALRKWGSRATAHMKALSELSTSRNGDGGGLQLLDLPKILPGVDEKRLMTPHSVLLARAFYSCAELEDDALDRGWGPYLPSEPVPSLFEDLHGTEEKRSDRSAVVKEERLEPLIPFAGTIRHCQELFDTVTEDINVHVLVPLGLSHRYDPGLMTSAHRFQSPVRKLGFIRRARQVTEEAISTAKLKEKAKRSGSYHYFSNKIQQVEQCGMLKKAAKKLSVEQLQWPFDEDDFSKGTVAAQLHRCSKK